MKMEFIFQLKEKYLFLDTPGNGVFQITSSPNPMDKRLGLKKVSDKFEFNFKIYDIGYEDFKEKIKKVWKSEIYKKNLGVILNGIKGGGKTIFTKILCNELGLPVILVDYDFEGQILPFITNLNFECIVFLDEAEKTFDGNPEVLLKLIDGAFNRTRKLYLLTTNELRVDDNLIDRPGRIRYIQEFGNLSSKAINECIEDNLNNLEYKDLIINTVDKLEFSTIDILKNIIEEVNMLGPSSLQDDIDNLNIPIASYMFLAEEFVGLEATKENIKLIIEEAEKSRDQNKNKDVREYTPLQYLLNWIKDGDVDVGFGYDEVGGNLKECSWVKEISFKTSYPELRKGMKIDNGFILEVFDGEYSGFFIYKNNGDTAPGICVLTDIRKPISIYKAY